MVQKIVAILLIIGAIVVADQNDGSGNIYCTDTFQCPKGTCCMLAPNSGAPPICVPKYNIADTCRLEYPMYTNPRYDTKGGEILNLTNVYEGICPCMEELECIEDSETNVRTCQNTAAAN